MTIDTREELITALQVACEVEHSLLVQYLYAGFSMKRGLDEGITPAQQQLLRAWQGAIYQIAIEEMGHLGIACNLLSSIGAGPKMGRRPIPSTVGYFPFPFELLPFGDESLHRFVIFELPRGAPVPEPPGADLSGTAPISEAVIAPDPLEYEYVGELYAKIANGFQNIPERDLFIGPDAAQSRNDWSDRSLDIRTICDRKSALDAIQNVIEDGEGTSSDSETSHYCKFFKIRKRYFSEGRFDGARKVPRNPATRPPAGGGDVTLVENPESRALVELFNAAYGATLLLLQHYFSIAPRTSTEARLRLELQRASQRMMSVAVRPLAEATTRAPLGDPKAPERAGPSFEIYTDITLSPFPDARLPIVLERLDNVIQGCATLGTERPRVASIGETLAVLREDLASAGGAS